MNNTFTNRPVTMNENKNLLEIEEHMYILDDVKKPNVFRNMFPYSEIPKIPFNDRTVPHDMPKDIWITDTTFRDGQQSRAPYSTEQIVTIYDYLHRLGGENGLIRASDTMGYGVNYPGAVIPRSVQGIIYALHTHAGVPHELLEWHGHNDFYKAVVNSSTAWLYGCSGVNTSLFGIGERTGNTPLEAMVFEYAQLRGTLNGMDTRVITELAEYYEKEIGYHIPPRTPFVGKNFNVTRAGIHADGLLKNEEIYNIFDTEKFLNRPVLCAVSNTSGLAGIAHWINTYFHLPEEKKLDKNCELVHEVKKWVDAEYESGRVTVLTDEELLKVIDDASKKLGILLV